jgi:hypothetical protein
MTQCAATSKRSGQRCKNHASVGYAVCHIHGGKTPRGAASPHYKTGRYSRDLPTRLAARYQEAQEDPELLNLRSEIALTDALLTELITKLDTGESGGLWRALEQTANAALAAKARGESDEATRQINALIGLVRRGAQEQEIVGEIRACLDQRRRLVESERKRLVEMQQVITAERAMLLVSAIASVVMECVSDPDVRAAISRGIDGLLARPDVAAIQENTG